MKKIVFILLLGSSLSVAQCPVKGDSRTYKLQHLDSLKNRQITGDVDSSVTLASVLAPGNDVRRFTDYQYVSLTGYVKLVKYGGAETCECHLKDSSMYDIHIELTDKPNGKNAMIVEVNRFIRARGLSVRGLRRLIGLKVKVTGWLFYDGEHWQNAVNTNPSGTNLWRTTCWEIHPVISVIPQ